MNIYSVNNGIINKVEISFSEEFVSIPNLYISEFDKDFLLIIDSFYNIIDIVPKHLVNMKNKSIQIKDRYSQTNLESGVEIIKRRYKDKIKEDISTKRVYI